MYDIKNEVRSRELKLGIAQLMESYYGLKITRRSVGSEADLFERYIHQDVTANKSQGTPAYPTTWTPPRASAHDFVARIISMEPLKGADDQDVTKVDMVVMDNHTILNGSDVEAALHHFGGNEISEAIAAEYYTGRLLAHKEKVREHTYYLPWIFGGVTGKSSKLFYDCFHQ